MGPKQKRRQKKHRQKRHDPMNAPPNNACTNNGSRKRDLKKQPENLRPGGRKEAPGLESASTIKSQTLLKPKTLCETIREWTEAVLAVKMFALALAALILFLLEVYIFVGAGLSRQSSPNPNDTDRLYPKKELRSPTAPQVRFQTINGGPIVGIQSSREPSRVPGMEIDAITDPAEMPR
jgi:hypothetical protein